ncbi:MAG: hypothetical protein WD179_12200 [Actinomycetota bacterium]
MNKLLKLLLVAVLALGGLSAGAVAQAQDNDAEDDISSETEQSGSSASGDAVGGLVVGVVSSGDTSVDATNHSEDVDIETGDAFAENDLEQEVGQDNDGGGAGDNELEDGEISSDVAQAATSTSGDGVGGAVIGVVTSAGGSADVVAANTSEDVDIETGESVAFNFLDADVGQGAFNTGDNDAEDDISLEAAQTASASTGDGVGGMVLGIVSAGDASVDATNESTDVDVSTGDAYTENDAELEVGQENLSGGDSNWDDGEISADVAQDAASSSGDAVAGTVAGVVTSAGGSADLVLANTSEDVDAETGDSEFVNELEEFVGQQISGDG